jgi:acetylornithine deacetylase/succinyl-diaminopimelate desuccinylase-like protein
LSILESLAVNSHFIVVAKPLDPIALFVPDGEQEDAIEVRFSSDCSTFAERFERVMIFGPGSIRQAHMQNEFIGLEALEEGAAKLGEILLLL